MNTFRYVKMMIDHYEFYFRVVTLFYTKIHSVFFIFLGVVLHYTIHHMYNLQRTY